MNDHSAAETIDKLVAGVQCFDFIANGVCRGDVPCFSRGRLPAVRRFSPASFSPRTSVNRTKPEFSSRSRSRPRTFGAMGSLRRGYPGLGSGGAVAIC